MNAINIYDLSLEWKQRQEYSKQLLQNISCKHFEEGTILYNQGDTPNEFFLIRQGKIEVSKNAPDGSRSNLEIIGTGEPIGIISLKNDFKYPASTKALKNTIAYRFTSNLVPRIQEIAPTWWSDCLGIAAKRVKKLTDRLESINTYEVPQQLSIELCKLAEKFGIQDKNHIHINFKLTRQMLADMIGCREESAIREMSKWEKKGFIDTNKSRITLKKPGKLYSLSCRPMPNNFKVFKSDGKRQTVKN